MKILGKRILIEPISVEKSAGGIFLPDALNPEHKDQEGIVRAIGNGIRESLPYRKGSHVFIEIYRANGSCTLVYKYKEYRLIEQDAICGVLIGNAFHPIGDRILLKPIKTVSRDSKIIRPSAYENDAEGLIECAVHLLGVGIKNKKGELRPFSVKIGDEVLVKPFCGRDVDTAEGTFKLVKETDIEAITN